MRCWPSGPGLRLLAAPLVLATALTGLGPAAASAATCQTKAARQPLSPGVSGNDLKGVAVLSPCNAWTVGWFANDHGDEQTLAEHWDGTTWTVVPTPSPGTDLNRLNSVRAVSAHDIWAVGSSGVQRQALIERYNGSAWTQVPAPTPGSSSVLNGVRTVSATDAWAVGSYQASGRSKNLILRWNGTAWKQLPGLNPGASDSLSSVAATSGHDVWAVGAAGTSVGDGGHSSAVILHWNGHRWRQAALPPLGQDSQLTGVGASSAASAWAVGLRVSGGDDRPLLLHWNGTRWKQFAGPPGISGVLSGVYVISARNAWAAGAAGATESKALLLHWNGSRWTRVSRPVPGTESRLNAIAANSAKNIWAVGDFSTPGGLVHLLGVHCC